MTPSPESATHLTSLVCPCSGAWQAPVRAPHTFTVWSEDPEAIVAPSTERATLLT